MGSSWKNKLVGAIATGAIVAGLFPMAALGAVTATPEETITVTGLKSKDDVAKYYQVLEYDQTAKTGWKLKAPFTGLTFSNGQTPDEVIAAILNGINADEAGAIAAKVTSSTEPTGTMAVDATTNTTRTATLSTGTGEDKTYNPGLFLVMVTPNDNKVIYSPMFVSSDFDDSTAATVSATESLPASTVATAKTTEMSIDKRSTNSTLDNNGDAGADNGETTKNNSLAKDSVVSFEVETPVPTYTTNVKNPTFKVSDKVSTGLTIDTTKVKVRVGSGVEQTVELNGVYNVDGSKATSESYDFKVEKLSGTEWLISFSANYLTKKATGNPTVLVKYEATVSASQFNVNEMTNTADVEYTHTPDGETTHETDDTHHYTYSLDGKLNGQGETEEITKELVKVGVDQNGDPIVTEKVTSVNKQQVTNALKGATFKLTAKTAKDANNKPIEYTAESKADGTITFNGLDAGEYTLEEVSAPLGWIKDDTVYNVKITPTFKVEEADTAHKGCYVLDKYTVEVTDADGNTKTSTFNMKYEKDGQTNEVVMTSSDGDDATFIKNKKAGLLPSTGGSGIFFYLAVGGAIAGISLYLMKKDEHAEAAE